MILAGNVARKAQARPTDWIKLSQEGLMHMAPWCRLKPVQQAGHCCWHNVLRPPLTESQHRAEGLQAVIRQYKQTDTNAQETCKTI